MATLIPYGWFTWNGTTTNNEITLSKDVLDYNSNFEQTGRFGGENRNIKKKPFSFSMQVKKSYQGGQQQSVLPVADKQVSAITNYSHRRYSNPTADLLPWFQNILSIFSVNINKFWRILVLQIWNESFNCTTVVFKLLHNSICRFCKQNDLKIELTLNRLVLQQSLV